MPAISLGKCLDTYMETSFKICLEECEECVHHLLPNEIISSFKI